MPNQLIYDNWTLQDVKDLYLSGLSDDSASKIVIDGKNDTHSFQDIPRGYIQIEVLFSFLQNLILRDLIVVDDKFTSTWDEDLRLKSLEEKGLISGHDFKRAKIFEVRNAIIDQACVTTSIVEIQKKNEEHYKNEGVPYDPFMSQIIWGGAGMLARSHVYETYYVPHPLRKYAFEQTPILSRDALEQTLNVIQSSRTKLFQYQNSTNKNTGIHASFSLPPLIVRIIEESNDVDDLIKIALELRDEYSELRLWIKQFQMAIESDDPKEISKFSKTLTSVQEHIESKYSLDRYGTPELDLLALSPSISIPISSNAIRNKFGIRSTLNDLILTQSGYKSLKKVFKLFGEKNSALSKKVYDELIKHYLSE